jgi:hypothetical protein
MGSRQTNYGGNMEKRTKRATKRRKPRQAKPAGHEVVVRQPITAAQRAELEKKKRRWSCSECTFCVTNLMLWAQTLLSGFPVLGMCANHPDTPGQLRPLPGTPCRNFRRRPCRTGGEAPVPPYPNTRYIPLTQNLHALVDEEDYERLKNYKWHVTRHGGYGTPYAARLERGHLVFMHRQIMNPPRGKVVDHINGNGLDNRRCNLRICDRRQNSHNSPGRAGRKSRFLGVYPRGNKWAASVGREYLGLFEDDVEAAKARDRRAREVYGEHAWLNFPPGSPEYEAISDK